MKTDMYSQNVFSLPADFGYDKVEVPPSGWVDDWLLFSSSGQGLQLLATQFASLLGALGMELAMDEIAWAAFGACNPPLTIFVHGQLYTRVADLHFLGVCISKNLVLDHITFRAHQAHQKLAIRESMFKQASASRSVRLHAYNTVFVPSLLWQMEAFALSGNALMKLDAECLIPLRRIIGFKSSDKHWEWRNVHRNIQELYISGSVRACSVQIYRAQERLHLFLKTRCNFDLNSILEWRNIDKLSGLSRKARPARAISGRPPRTLYEEFKGRPRHSVIVRALVYARKHQLEPF